MDAQLSQVKIKAVIKQLLKKQDRSYADLARVWGCSVPTVKRQLGREELPLSRLLSLLEWLDLSLGDLHKLAESEDSDYPRYTLKQNEFLAKNPREFSFLMKLHEDMTPAKIAAEYKIPKDMLEKILIQLEKYDLISVGSGGKVRPAHNPSPRLEGPLAEAHMGRIIDRMATFQKRRLTDVFARKARGLDVPKGSMSWVVTEVTEKTYLHYLPKFGQLLEEMVSVAKLEEMAKKKSELKVAIAGFGVYMCEQDDPNLYLARDVMDEGLRL